MLTFQQKQIRDEMGLSVQLIGKNKQLPSKDIGNV
jgi:hypothetical protein